ncbi:hypothetical protein HDU82_001035, partial [Entophlyctis luteolus]
MEAAGPPPEQRKTGPKLPIMALILFQLGLVIVIITIPLGYISFNSSAEITDDLTYSLIESVARESKDGIIAALQEVVVQTNLVNSDPAIDTIVQYYYSDFSVAQ